MGFFVMLWDLYCNLVIVVDIKWIWLMGVKCCERWFWISMRGSTSLWLSLCKCTWILFGRFVSRLIVWWLCIM